MISKRFRLPNGDHVDYTLGMEMDGSVRVWQRPYLKQILTWGGLFVLLVVAIWAATQNRNAPLLILLAVLYIITVNFSLPPDSGSVGLVPIVAVSSLLVLGLETAVTLLLVGYLLAELIRPVWQPVWQGLQLPHLTWLQRLVPAFIHLLALLGGAIAFQNQAGILPLNTTQLSNLAPFIALILAFGFVYFVLQGAWWLAQKWSIRDFLSQNSVGVLTAGLLALPFAVLGGMMFVLGGLSVYIIFCVGIAIFSVIVWLSWQRRYSLQKQLAQFAALNRSSDSLRETLELPEVLARTYSLVAELMRFDQFTIHLLQKPDWFTFKSNQHGAQSYERRQRPLDDFAAWVVANGRLLDLDPGNMHFAAQHDLAIPDPKPTIWLGFPLTSADELIGVMVLQRFGEARPFSPWNQELLRSVAAQTSTAVQNARLYQETVRLYNLTDEALAERLRQLQALLNAMTEGVLMVDRNGVVVMINPTAQRLFGDDAPEPQQPLPTAVTASKLGFTVQALKEKLSQIPQEPETEPARTHYPLTIATEAAMAERIIERQEIPVIDRYEQPLGWLFLLRDVTEAQELAERREDLTRMIVHDLRNPLTTIASTILTAEIALQAAAEQPDGLLQTLTDSRAASLDLLDMVDSLMDINRVEAGQSIVDADAMRLPGILHKVTRRLQPLLAHKQINLSLQEAPDLPPVWADAELVRRILVNLLDNAVKFTPAHGRITIYLEAETAVNGAEPGVRCIIQDTGPGIPPEFREQLFDRFMRTNIGGAQVRGTGLGLTFCKMAVEAQNGRIWVEDAPEQGTQFVFTLPGIPNFES